MEFTVLCFLDLSVNARNQDRKLDEPGRKITLWREITMPTPPTVGIFIDFSASPSYQSDPGNRYADGTDFGALCDVLDVGYSIFSGRFQVRMGENAADDEALERISQEFQRKYCFSLEPKRPMIDAQAPTTGDRPNEPSLPNGAKSLTAHCVLSIWAPPNCGVTETSFGHTYAVQREFYLPFVPALDTAIILWPVDNTDSAAVETSWPIGARGFFAPLGYYILRTEEVFYGKSYVGSSDISIMAHDGYNTVDEYNSGLDRLIREFDFNIDIQA
jgi:hypothetical protein